MKWSILCDYFSDISKETGKNIIYLQNEPNYGILLFHNADPLSGAASRILRYYPPHSGLVGTIDLHYAKTDHCMYSHHLFGGDSLMRKP